MRFQLNFKSGKPVYLQIADQVKAAVASGAARTGDPLPSIRPLAEDLRVNRNTIAKAYAELESQGVIETAAGKGSVISSNNTPLRKDARMARQEIDQPLSRRTPGRQPSSFASPKNATTSLRNGVRRPVQRYPCQRQTPLSSRSTP
jgi:GntR family transcriptional regulator